MHRFRKKSDAKRNPLPDLFLDTEGLPGLPPASDFRTSLILPDLTRRFTLLRTAAGDPVSLNDLRSRFAEQRARGAENQVSEEEEDMILETLGRIRADNSRHSGKTAGLSTRSNSSAPDSDSNDTTISSVSPGSITSSSNKHFTKRYSNNLFGSGRFRDETYLRSVQAQKTGSQRSAVSVAPTSIEGSLRSTTPDGSVPNSSVQSSPEKVATADAASSSPSPYEEPPVSVAEYRMSKAAHFRQASLALEEVMKEIEEEAEDEIVMPRSVPAPRNIDQNLTPTETNDFQSPIEYEAGTAISSDKEVVSEPEDQCTSPVPHGRPGTTSPTPRLPGYIPGMPRPMTPRDLAPEVDEQTRSHSTTPRATSPLLPGSNDHSSLASGSLRRDSNVSTSRHSPRPTSLSSPSPLFLPRVPNGNFLSDNHQRNGDSFSLEFDNAVNSSILGRRRPASPLSGPAYQPMTVSPRPSTPSNITWNIPVGSATPKIQGGNDNVSGHNRHGSWVSESGSNSEIHSMLGRSKTARSLRSPALPESPILDRGSPSGWNSAVDTDKRQTSAISGVEPGSPPPTTNRILRSPTPTQSAPQSPASATFSSYDVSPAGSPRSSKQTAPSSPFTLGPFHPLVFSPLANSSRSSLESAGSSYHSSDGERKDRGFSLFSDNGTPQSVWHDLSTTDKSSSATPGDSQDECWDAEGIIARYAGLTKSDFVAIQEKLVGAAIARTATPDIRDRVPSLRRRRPSTSQSNYSLNGRDTKVVSPLLRNISPATLAPNSDKTLKASALLDSVVDSIQSPRIQTVNLDVPATRSEGEPSPTTRRNRDLAQVLFGVQDRDRRGPTAPQEPTTTEAVILGQSSTDLVRSSPSPDSTASLSERTDIPVAPYHESSFNLRSPTDPQAPEDQTELAREVQRKADAAMMALQRSPSHANSDRIGVSGSISRRRINPAQISTPRLVSASTSVDTIPLRPPSAASGNLQGASRLGQRFRKLRGTLRSKTPVFPGEEVTPYPLDLQSPPASQTAFYEPANLKVPGEPTASSATELGAFKVPVPSPPASAGPGLRGFMARFRKHRTVDVSHDQSFRGLFQNPPTSPLVSPSIHQEHYAPSTSHLTSDYHEAQNPPPSRQTPKRGPVSGDVVTSPSTNGVEDSAVEQLFAAASNLGLDQAALNELLARSDSVRSTGRSMLARNDSTTAKVEPETPDRIPPNRARSPALSDGRPSIGTTSGRPDDTVVRKPSIRKSIDHVRRPRNGQDENTAAVNAIVRRTIIFPSETKSSTIDLNILMRKHSQSTRRRRSGSVASMSSRSVHDRVPTPPPPRSLAGRRFSKDHSPPVPQLPPSFSFQGDSQSPPQLAPAGPIEKSSSTYDSLYEMYAGDSKAPTPAVTDPNRLQMSRNSEADPLTGSESGPALEVIEMANGETIWSIVNGLRDDDTESLFGNRASFTSEYSMREANGVNGDGVQVVVKEHSRKTSSPSFLSRKKSQGSSRPETKVFYSSSAQIGRLIENLSHGMDAGSFNILPSSASRGHSHSSSFQSENDVHWTVEERLEHMLGSLGGT